MINAFQNKSNDTRLYMFLRLMMLYSVLISLVIYQRSAVFENHVIVKTYFITFFTFLVTTGFIFLNERMKKIGYFLYSQILYDLIFTSILIYYTGPFDSVYSYFFFFNIIFSAILFDGRVCFFTAVLSALIYSAIGFLSGGVAGSEKTFSLLTTITAFLGISLLATQFMQELRRSRQKISRLEALSEEIVDSLDSGLIGIDSSGMIQKINRTSKDMLGIESRTALYGKKLEDVFPILNSIQSGEIRELMIKGKRRRILMSRISIPENHIMILLRDLTEILELEQKIRRQERLASIGSLAAGIAHEIRNPIASISGSAQIMVMDPTTEKDRLLNIILKEVERVNRLIDQLLKFSKPSSDQKEKINLKVLCEDLIESLKTRNDFVQSKAELSFLSDGDSLFDILGNKDELRELMNNLFVNALHAIDNESFKKGKTGKISFSIKRKDNVIQLSVEDNGIGIPKSFREKIFDPFFTTKSGGTGLGLAQVYKIVKDHNANLELESEEGVGSVFKIQFSAI